MKIRALLSVAVALAAAFVFLGAAIDSLAYWHWGDEDEKIVAAWMIAEGGALYGDIFAHHGPLNYALAHAVYLATESVALAPYRAVQWGIMLLTGIALASSALMHGWQQRLIVASVFCTLVALLAPLWYGHTLLYHGLGGAAVSIALSLLLLPLIFRSTPPRLAAALGGASLAAALFAAYSFAVSVVLLLLATLVLVHLQGRRWREVRRPLLAAATGFAGFTLLMLLWLWQFGDLVGYGVYHLWFNQAVYAGFVDFSFGDALKQMEKLFQSPLGWVLQAVVLFALLIAIETHTPNPFNQRADRKLRRWLWHLGAYAAFIAGVLFLNPRGDVVFKNAALWIVGLGLLSMLIVWRPHRVGSTAAITVLRAWGAVVAIAAPVYLIGIKAWDDVDEHYVTRAFADKMRAGSQEQLRLVDALVPAGDPILAMVFQPRWYLMTHRLPSSGAYYYLPWQAAYNRSPLLGYRLDPCADLAARPPKLLVWDRWRVWDQYDVTDYSPCLVEIMRSDYLAISGTPFLLRKPVSVEDRERVAALGFGLEPLAVGE